MGKKVKYCSVCNINFTEKFLYCPNCAASLGDFESNLTQTKSNTEDGFYNITLVEERGNNKRTLFLFGSAILVLGGAAFSLIGSIYNTENYVDALDESLVYLANINNDEPYKFEETDLPKDKVAGQGGSGGNKDKKPVSKGVLASQSENPLIAPSVSMTKLTNPEIKIRMETKGLLKRKPSDQPYGDENSKYNVLSDGDGENGGQGNGRDRGQGPGKGPGGGMSEGPGIGVGPGGVKPPKQHIVDEEDNKAIPPIAKGETIALKIIDKPRAIYTNDARENLVSGTVTLRVTFMANGSIGNIAVIGGLPDGLTEQAIAAAKGIKFEPAKRNGVALTVTKQIQYTFTLY